jgi:hypothetical protein
MMSILALQRTKEATLEHTHTFSLLIIYIMIKFFACTWFEEPSSKMKVKITVLLYSTLIEKRRKKYENLLYRLWLIIQGWMTMCALLSSSWFCYGEENDSISIKIHFLTRSKINLPTGRENRNTKDRQI